MIAIAHPLLGNEEKDMLLRVLESGQLAQGACVAGFELRFAELCQVHDAVAVSSGTAALLLALLAHDIGPGDEVITTAFSFTATANTILLVGATPVFVDIEPETYTLNPDLVEQAVTRRTRAILPVHLYGHPCDMQRLEEIAQAHELVIIEDAAQAHAAMIGDRYVGSFGTGCFSFYATKNITTGEGGMVTTNDPAIAEKVRLLRNHGQQSRYNQVVLGYNLRMTELQGALGLAQMDRLAYITEQRIANASYLTDHLKDVVLTPITLPGCCHVYHQYTIRVRGDSNELAVKLRACDIETGVHYPLPIYRQPFYRNMPSLFRIANVAKSQRARGNDASKHLPITERAAQSVLSLPVHPSLSEADLTTIVKEVQALCV